MVICGSHMFELNVSKDMGKKNNNDKKENSNTSSSIFSSINCQGIENQC